MKSKRQTKEVEELQKNREKFLQIELNYKEMKMKKLSTLKLKRTRNKIINVLLTFPCGNINLIAANTKRVQRVQRCSFTECFIVL